MEDFKKYLEQNSMKDKLKSLFLVESEEEKPKDLKDLDLEIFKNSIINKLKSDSLFIQKLKGDKGDKGEKGLLL